MRVRIPPGPDIQKVIKRILIKNYINNILFQIIIDYLKEVI